MSEDDRAAVFEHGRDPIAKGKHAAAMRRVIFEVSTRSTGFVCLSERKDSLLMWAHYAQRHEGFVIGFDLDEWNLTQGDAVISDRGHLRQVVYSASRPSARYLTELSRQDMFFTKGKEWAYEAEWRVGRALPIDNDELTTLVLKSIGGVPIPAKVCSDVYLFDFARSSVREVISGVRSSRMTQMRIKKILRQHSSYCSVDLYTAELDQSSFQLVFNRP
jgi:hypothetical protein